MTLAVRGESEVVSPIYPNSGGADEIADRVFHWCRCHFGLAVLRQYGERDDRELVTAA
jgi:hypothetical protein